MCLYLTRASNNNFQYQECPWLKTLEVHVYCWYVSTVSVSNTLKLGYSEDLYMYNVSMHTVFQMKMLHGDNDRKRILQLKSKGKASNKVMINDVTFQIIICIQHHVYNCLEICTVAFLCYCYIL